MRVLKWPGVRPEWWPEAELSGALAACWEVCS